MKTSLDRVPSVNKPISIRFAGNRVERWGKGDPESMHAQAAVFFLTFAFEKASRIR